MTRLLIVVAAVLALIVGCGSSDPPPVPRNPDAVSPPVSVSIPSIDAESSLIRLGLNPDKTMQVPDVKEPKQAGWFAFSKKPGEPGTAVIAGHVDGNRKPGIFYQLGTLKPGAAVIIERSDGTRLEYAVIQVRRTDKDEFPTDEVYGHVPESELRLITCGGAWEGGQTGYADNVIVHARLV